MATKIDKPIKNFLVDFGLTDKEITVYLTLLKTGPNTIMNLARETGIKRSTTHNTVEELIKKGLVSQTNYGERRMVVAEDPKKLEFLMEQKRWDMKKLEDNLPDIVKSIYESVPAARENSQIEVKYYTGEKEIRYVYDLSLKSEKVYSFADLNRYYKIFPETRNIWREALDKNPKREVYDIVIDSDIAREISKGKHSRYYIKFIKNNLSSELFDFADYLIFDNKVAIIELNPEHSVATVIESKHIAMSLKLMHQTLWKLIP